MTRTPSEGDKATATYTAVLWMWTIVAAVGTGIAFGNMFATQNAADSGDTTFSGGAFVGGLIVGAFSTIPFWAVFGLGKLVHRNLITLRTDLAAQAAAPSA